MEVWKKGALSEWLIKLFNSKSYHYIGVFPTLEKVLADDIVYRSTTNVNN